MRHDAEEIWHDRYRQSRTFPLGGRTVRRIGYGAMQLAGPAYSAAERSRRRACGAAGGGGSGVNHIDTSDFYGPHITNQLIREALHPYRTIWSSSPRSARGGGDGSWTRPSRPKT